MTKPVVGWFCALFCALFSLSAAFANSGGNIFTVTNGRACEDRSRSEVGLWRCPGPAGYIAEYGDEGNVARFAIWMPRHRTLAARAVTWRGAGRVFGERLQWKVSAGEPTAAILRIWRVSTQADGEEHEVEELMILRVSSEGACRVASVDGRLSGANEIADKQSGRVSVLPCLDEW